MSNRELSEIELILKALDALDDIQAGINALQEGEYPCPVCLTGGTLIRKDRYGKPAWECEECGSTFAAGFDFTRVMKSRRREIKYHQRREAILEEREKELSAECTMCGKEFGGSSDGMCSHCRTVWNG